MLHWGDPEDPDRILRLGLEAIGASVRIGRLRRGYSQRQLGWRVGLAQSTISRLESGTIKGMRLPRLALIFGLLEWGPRATITDDSPGPTRWLPGQRLIISTDPERDPFV